MAEGEFSLNKRGDDNAEALAAQRLRESIKHAENPEGYEATLWEPRRKSKDASGASSSGGVQPPKPVGGSSRKRVTTPKNKYPRETGVLTKGENSNVNKALERPCVTR